MAFMRWLPWKFVLRRVARAHGFLDPVALLARLDRLAQPSDVAQPVELLRAGAVLHARGLINSRVVQHNLDWVWPFWIERQFDPRDAAFIPRAFSITHINLTHRNWTAIGLPDCDALPIVDPRGLVTPLFDGWSLDTWVVTDDGRALLPSRTAAKQRLDLEGGVAVETELYGPDLSLRLRAEVEAIGETPACRIAANGRAAAPGWLVLTLRPYNPEGISFIHEVTLSSDRRLWTIDRGRSVQFSAPADRHHVSNYRAGDVYIHLRDAADENAGECLVGIATAAALFRLEPNRAREIVAHVPLADADAGRSLASSSWRDSLIGACELRHPDGRLQFLYDAALRSLILHCPGEVYAGPFTYRRFWFRDAALIINGLLCAGLMQRAERALDQFPGRQHASGYFHSQDGEWDSNGEALWAMGQFCAFAGCAPKPEWWGPIDRGARWIRRKRTSDDGKTPHAGLLPAGFSAEHLGPNDYYYWDDFWSIAGLEAAAELARSLGKYKEGDAFRREAGLLRKAVDRSLSRVSGQLGRAAMPASPYRRLDAGAIGSLAAGYPLRLFAPGDQRLLDTVEYLLKFCFIDGGFFQDITHSGINPYLSLHVAQVLLRAGDPRYLGVLQSVAALASPTGQWPEAVHPSTRGGCMGDGQHIWAAAEWIVMIRNCFLREEGDGLILGSGIAPSWLDDGSPLSFGPAPTAFGPVTLTVEADRDEIHVSWRGDWHRQPPRIELRLPGSGTVPAAPDQTSLTLKRRPLS